MSAAEQASAPYEEYETTGPDKVSRVLTYGIVLLVISLLCVIIYALLVGIFVPPAPRTLVESSLLEAEAAVKKDPGNGKAWAALAGAQWAGGDRGGAWETLERARKAVKDRTILLVNVKHLQFLLAEGKDAQALKKADEYIELEAKTKVEELNAQAAKGITVPSMIQNNSDAIQLFLVKATAQGNLGKWKEAVTTLDSALLLDDRAADLLRMRGWAKLKAGDAKGARGDFEQALQFLPGDESATQGLEQAKAAE